MAKRSIRTQIGKNTRSQRKTRILSIRKTAKANVEWKDWISGTQTKNYILRDPLLDYLKEHCKADGSKKSGRSRRGSGKSQSKDQENLGEFTSFLLDKGNDFEKRIVKDLKRKFGSDFISLGGAGSAQSVENYQKTLDAIYEQIPIIHDAVLWDETSKIYGIADLIVRSDYLAKLVNIDPSTFVDDPIEKQPLHYRIIDIKFTTLKLCCDGVYVLNSGLLKAYKSQIYIYTKCLAKIQNYTPRYGYLLGRGWSFTKNNETFSKRKAFDRLGVIDFKERDLSIPIQTQKAIDWIREVRTDEAREWNITKYPLERPELYPNMCNFYDTEWRQVKEEIAEKNKEITSVWMLGPKHRAHALERGIYSWNQVRDARKDLGFKSDFTPDIIDKMLKVNKSRSLKMLPRKIQNNADEWMHREEIEFYVDFETISNFYDTSDKFSDEILFLIGVGWCRNKTWHFKYFLSESTSDNQQAHICRKFMNYIQKVAKIYKCSRINCVHWSKAEPTCWDRIGDRLGIPHLNIHWIDLLKVFKDEPIVLKGCFDFSLKSVTKAMHQHGFISINYDDSEIQSGQVAMLEAYKIYNSSQRHQISRRMRDIIKYNEIDCQTLFEIIEYLRENCL